MKVILFILPLCLFTTFSTKRAGNLNQLISSKVDAHLHITDEDEERNNIHRHSVKLDNIFMLTLIDNDGSGSLKCRHLLNGLSGHFYAIAIKKHAPVYTENYCTKIYTDIPSQLFNKGSPENENSKINYYTTNLENTNCLYKLLHQYYSLLTLFSKATPSLLAHSQYSAIKQLQPLFLSQKMRLRIFNYKKRLETTSDLTTFKKVRPPP